MTSLGRSFKRSLNIAHLKSRQRIQMVHIDIFKTITQTFAGDVDVGIQLSKNSFIENHLVGCGYGHRKSAMQCNSEAHNTTCTAMLDRCTCAKVTGRKDYHRGFKRRVS